MRKKILFWSGIIISIVFLCLVFKKVDFAGIKHSLESVNYLYLLPAVIIYLSSFLLRGLRWEILFKNIKPIPFWNLLSALMIGFMSNLLLPLRMGEFVRAYCIGKKENISKSLSLGTIFLERILDGFTLIFFLLVILLFFPFPQWLARTGYFLSFLFIGGLAFFFLLIFNQETAVSIFKKITAFLPLKVRERLSGYLNSFISGLGSLRDLKLFGASLVLSVAVWMIEVLMYSLVIRAFSPSIPFYASLLILVLINFGVLLPSAPGYIGTYHYFAKIGLLFFGVSNETAVSFSLLLYALMYLSIAFPGLYFLWRENISLMEIKAKEV